MPLSTKLDDNNSQPIGEGYIRLSTSAGNALVFRDPASANSYRLANPAQFAKGAYQEASGGFNDENQAPIET